MKMPVFLFVDRLFLNGNVKINKRSSHLKIKYMKKTSKVIKEFLNLDEKERNAIFELSFDLIPSIETRAKILRALPMTEAVRLINSIEMEFCLERIFSAKDGKKYFLKLFPKLLPERLVGILFETGGFTFWKDVFNFLPVDTVVRLIDCAVGLKIKGKREDTFYVFYPVEFLVASKEAVAKDILDKISPISFEKIINESSDLGQDILRTYVSSLSSKRITELCNVLSPAQANKILLRIEDAKKQKTVLSLLPQKFRDAFFSKSSKKNLNLNITDTFICITNLNLKAKKAFVKNFPNSKQIDKLPFKERLEVLFS